MKTFIFSLVLRTHETTDVFITLDENIFGIHSKRVNILYIFRENQEIYFKMLSAKTFSQHTEYFLKRYKVDLNWKR